MCECEACGCDCWIDQYDCGCAPWGCEQHAPSWWQPVLFPAERPINYADLNRALRDTYLPMLQGALTRNTVLLDLLTRPTPSRWPFFDDVFQLQPQSVSQLESETGATFTWAVHTGRNEALGR